MRFKLFLALTVCFVLLTSCGGSEKSLLKMSGYSFEDIKSVHVSGYNYNGDPATVEIEKAQFEFINNYNYAGEFPSDRLNEMYIFPGTFTFEILFRDDEKLVIYVLNTGEFVIGKNNEKAHPESIFASEKSTEYLKTLENQVELMLVVE